MYQYPSNLPRSPRCSSGEAGRQGRLPLEGEDAIAAGLCASNSLPLKKGWGWGLTLHHLKSLFKISNNIVNMLDADRDSQQGGQDSRCQLISF